MFFRRMFSRKDNGTSAPLNANSSVNRQQNAIPYKSPKKSQRRLSTIEDSNKRGLSVLQLTPLWEHIIRTRRLPEDINLVEMFQEFLERLKDPEWQVRQHALRVLVDVLTVIGPKSDTYFAPLIPQLVENLGHPAPTVRKGALDCLRVYIVETTIPETIILEILDIGLNQRITNEPFGGRLTCGVMLSLPSLVQATLHTSKRSYILRSTIEMLINKMTQLTHQEITLKVLLKLKELIGPREFSEYMSHATYREFDILCNVYGIGEKNVTNANRSSWHLTNLNKNDESTSFSPSEIWRPLSGNCGSYDLVDENDYCKDSIKEKVIMETEIKINDDTLTMRILETSNKTDTEEDEKIVNNSDNSGEEIDDAASDDVILENSGLIQILTDSELEEINKNAGEINEDYVRRTPKRVTFGGEVIKMRTPDSDTVTQSDGDDISNKNASSQNKLSFLTVDIPNDNTKPIVQPPQQVINRSNAATSSPSKSISKSSPTLSTSQSSSSQNSPPSASSKRKSQSADDHRPKSGSPFRRISISSVDTLISPRQEHKEVEVLHNLQRSPSVSPRRSRRSSSAQQESKVTEMITTLNENLQSSSSTDKKSKENEPKAKFDSVTTTTTNTKTAKIIKSWESLGLVDESVIKNLKSGDWRLRSHAICEIENALKSSENLALVQPYLDSLLRTLLSSEKNLEVAEDKRRVIMNLISRLPLDNLEDRTGQIITGLCRQGGPGSNRVSKTLMQRLPPAVIVLKLLSDEFLHTRSSKFRENALQMVMYALMTFPSTFFDTNTCVTRATYAALDRKKRVRQASLDVLAVLGQVASPRTVMEIVQNIGNQREDGINLCKAVKARLARKQLPIVSPDGHVQYALRIPSPQINEPEQLAKLGADIEWIASGIGSVSPTSLKRRTNSHLYYQQPTIPTPTTVPTATTTVVIPQNINSFNGKIYSDLNRDNMDEEKRQKVHNAFDFDFVGMRPKDTINGRTKMGGESFRNLDGSNLQYSNLSTGIPVQISTLKQINKNGSDEGDIIGIFGKRVGTKSCSDSSQDGRSSDSTNGRSVRYTSKLPITSRFPAMERLNVTDIYVERPSIRNSYGQQIYTSSTSSSSQHELNATFPKANYSVYQQKKMSKTMNQDTESSYESSSYSNGSSSAVMSEINVSQNSKRFMNVDKFIMQSNKQQHQPQGSSQQNRGTKRTTENSPKLEKPFESHHESLPVPRGTETITCPLRTNNNHHQIINLSEISSSDEKISSNHSSPTRVIGHAITPANSHSDDYHIHIKVSNTSLERDNKQDNLEDSRPQSRSSSKSVIFIKNNLETSQNLENKKNLDVPEPTIIKELQKLANGDITNVEDIGHQEISVLKNPDGTTEITETIKAEEIDVPHEISQPIETTQEIKAENEKLSEESKKDDVEVNEEKEKEVPNQNLTEDMPDTTSKPVEPEPPARSPVPTMEVKPITREETLTKSCESVFEMTSIPQDNDVKSNTSASTETSSDYQPSHAASLDNQPHSSPGFVEVKAQHTPLMRKSKTAFFNRNRRVSPVKQQVKLNKATDAFPPTLTHFDKPKEALNVAINQLDSSSWETIMIGLKSLVRLMKYHPDILDTQIHMICMQLTKSVRNLRSQVSRAACQASTELFSIHSKYLEIECDDLVGSLLHRTADTNRFLRADAIRALESMCDSLTPQKILQLLTTRGSVHQNALVRTTAAKLLNRLADRLGCDKIFAMNREYRDKFILTGANLLLEGSLETRSYAKSLFRLLSEHHSYNRTLLEVIPTKTYRNIEKTLKSITK